MTYRCLRSVVYVHIYYLTQRSFFLSVFEKRPAVRKKDSFSVKEENLKNANAILNISLHLFNFKIDSLD